MDVAGAALPAAPPALPRHRRYLAPGHLFRWAGAFTMRGTLCVCQSQCRPGTAVAVQVTGPVPACCSLGRLWRSQPAGTASCECSGCGDSGGAGAPGAPIPDPTSAASSCAGPINGRLLAMPPDVPCLLTDSYSCLPIMCRRAGQYPRWGPSGLGLRPPPLTKPFCAKH